MGTTKAQKHEIGFSYSPFSFYGFEKFVDDAISNEGSYRFIGALNFDYYYYVKPRLKIGISAMHDKATEEGHATPKNNRSNYPVYQQNTKRDYKATKSTYVIAPQIEYEYVKTNRFALCSGLSIGYAHETYTDKDFLSYDVFVDGLTYHINLLGFKWGNKYGLSGNCGYGYKGLINIGCFIRL